MPWCLPFIPTNNMDNTVSFISFHSVHVDRLVRSLSSHLILSEFQHIFSWKWSWTITDITHFHLAVYFTSFFVLLIIVSSVSSLFHFSPLPCPLFSLTLKILHHPVTSLFPSHPLPLCYCCFAWCYVFCLFFHVSAQQRICQLNPIPSCAREFFLWTCICAQHAQKAWVTFNL